MLASIKDILIISTPVDLPHFKKHFGNGSHLGINLEYEEQAHPNGLSEAFIIGERFIGKDSVCLILGDNIFFAHGLQNELIEAIADLESYEGSVIYGYYVKDPERYGVVEFDKHNNPIGLVEKPEKPKSNYAVIGLYFYDNTVVEKVKTLKPSSRGELEITDLNRLYLNEKKLKVRTVGRGFAWLDTGTHESLFDASNFVKTVEDRQGLKIACLEEIAWKQGWITKPQMLALADKYGKSSYGSYLKSI
jgi:glucose-1-phosphate thymidylyltransferase